MAACPSCRAATDPIDRFCGRCGHGLVGVAPVDSGVARYCGGCGRSLQPDARFCRRCGAGVPDAGTRQATGAPNGRKGSRRAGPILAGSRSGDAPTETIPQQRGFPARPPEAASRTATATIERPSAPPITEEGPSAPLRVPEARRERAPASGFPWGGTLALVGSLAVIVSAILDWGGPFRSTLPRDISATWLLDPSGLVSGPSLGLVMLLAGTLGALVSLVGMAAPSFTFLRRFVGLLTLMVPIGFAFRTLQLTEGTSLLELPSVLGVGAIVAAAGALLELAPGRPRVRQV